MKNVLFHGFDRQYKKTLEFLNQNYKWKPTINIGKKENQEYFKKNFNDLNFICIEDLRKFKLDKILFNIERRALSLDEIDKVNNFKDGYFETFDDTTGFNYSFEERRQIMLDFLSFWKSIISHYKIDILIFFQWPHRNDCYALYLLAKHIFNLKILIIDTAFLIDNKFQTILTDLHKLHHPFMKKYENRNLMRNSKDVKEFIDRVNNKENNYIYLNYVNNSAKNSLLKLLLRFIKLILLTIYKGTGFSKEYSYYKKNNKSYLSDSSKLNLFEYEIFVLNKILKISKLKKFYKNLTERIDYDKKFILFAAPYQPEPNSSAILLKNNHCIYTNLLMISEALPKDWIILYKEHPTSFKLFPHNRSIFKRNKELYLKIKKIKNVKIIDHDLNINKLIEYSQCIITMGGTIGIEATIKGKPVINLGNCWYFGCKSILSAKNTTDLKNAFKKISEGFKPNESDVEDYLHAVCESSEKNITFYKFSLVDKDKRALIMDKLPEQNKRLSEFLFKKFNEFYS